MKKSIAFPGICKTKRHKCDLVSSYCVHSGDNNENDHICQCRDGYASQGVHKCLDYCEAGFNYCDKQSTVCVPTPGIGPNYRCDCLNKAHLKQAYYKCEGPLRVENETSDTSKY